MKRSFWMVGIAACLLVACESSDSGEGSSDPGDVVADAECPVFSETCEGEAVDSDGDGCLDSCALADAAGDTLADGDVPCLVTNFNCPEGGVPIDTDGDGCPDTCEPPEDIDETDTASDGGDTAGPPKDIDETDTAGDGGDTAEPPKDIDETDTASDAGGPCPDWNPCPPNSKGIDTDEDGCLDTCALVCEEACDCYAAGAEFDKPCDLECDTCGNFWACEDYACVAKCDIVPPELAMCDENYCGGNGDCESGFFCQFPDGICSVYGACKPMPAMCTKEYFPVCGCDGATYENDCFASMAGTSVAFMGPCEGDGPGTACDSDGMCKAGEFCHFLDGLCGGTGYCEEIPDSCSNESAPVCGCDGQTYPNSCHAAMASQSVLESGECDAAGGDVCGGIAGLQCEEDEFCVQAEGMCQGADIPGICTPLPLDGCLEIYDPVCGCDGQTYGNPCEALAAQAQVDHAGECGGSCIWGGDPVCAKSEFCMMFVGTCLLDDWTGACTPKPEFCTEEYDPVCGCDGNTYDNECKAWKAGASISWEDDCKKTP